MPKVTKARAEEAAKKLLEKKIDDLKQKEKAIAAKVKHDYLKSLPKKVIESWEDPDIKQYMYGGSGIHLYENKVGHPGYFLHVDESVPRLFPKTARCYNDELLKRYSKLKKQKEEIREAHKQLVISLCAMSVKAVIKEYPELKDIVSPPPPSKNLPSDPSSLRKIIDNVPTP